jgi:nucleoside-diphosphate-sugar epimerase
VDIFDSRALTQAVGGYDVACHLASHIPALARAAMRSQWRTNDRIWSEAARNLVEAALTAGTQTYIHQSSGFMYADGGDRWLDEDSPIDPPPHGAAVVQGEAEATRFAKNGGTAISLRFGLFYGPTAASTLDFVRMARRVHVSIPGRPTAYYTSIHTDDLGTAAAAALSAPGGAHNIVDDDPLTRREYADAFARALCVKKLRVPRVPRMKRMDYLLRSQRVSNKRFKEATGWAPAFPSAREGWPAVVAATGSS